MKKSSQKVHLLFVSRKEKRREDLDTNYENGKKTNEAADDGSQKRTLSGKMVEAFGSVVEWFEPPLNLRLI